MMKFIWIIGLIFANATASSIQTSQNDINNWNEIIHHRQDDDPGEPLFLTPLIQDGRLDEAKNLSRIGPLSGMDIESYSGYLTVNSKFNSNMFFCYVLAQNNAATAPVVLWLQGGPGGSDQFSLFFETGPFYVDDNLQLQPKNYSWNTNFNMLYIDNPVGTGYSFTDSDDGYAQNETVVAHDLYQALTQILTLFAEHQNNEFYVTGESYAGKYIPSIAYEIFLQNQKTSSLKINLKGVAIGNGLIDPVTMNNYGDYLYNIGLIDDPTRLIYLENQDRLVNLVKQGNFTDAFLIFDYLVNGDFSNQSLFTNATGFKNYFNFLYSTSNIDESPAMRFLEQPSVRKAIHVGNRTNNDGSKVEGFFLEDFMNSTKPQLETLIDNGFKTMLYSGQLDIIIPYVFTENMVNSMAWENADQFRNAPRVIWKVDSKDEQIAGYAKQFANFSLVLIRNAGHMAPHDQPRASFDLISRFVAGKPFE